MIKIFVPPLTPADVVSLADNNGTVIINYDFDPFGNQLSPVTATDKNPYRYSGEYYDFENGYTYLQARYCDTRTGRFISEDPAFDGGNWYAYCGSDPINRNDPSGKFWETIIDIFSIGVSAKDLITNPSWGNAGYLLWDVSAAVLPFAPGSYVAKGVKAGSKTVKKAKTSTKVAMKVANSASDFKKGNYLVGSYSGLKKAFKGKGQRSKYTILLKKDSVLERISKKQNINIGLLYP
jgi:RHS repeat-associated protein